MPQEKIIIKFEPSGDKKLINAINALTKAQANLEGRIVKTSAATGRHSKKQDQLNNSALLGVRNNRLLGNAFATLRSKLLLATFAITLFIKPLIRMLEEAAKVKALSTAFDTLTGSTEGAVASLNKLREATDNTMNSTDLLQQANNALILGVAKGSDEMAEMFDMAQRLGRALGRDTASSVESLITGIGRQSRLMLDNIGIIVKAEEAYEAYATELGVSVDKLSDAQKKQAFFNATMESAREKVSRLGAETLTTQDIFNRAGASFDNLKVAIGDKLNPAIVGMTTKTANAADSMATFIRELDFGTVNDMKNELADLGATMKEISMAEAIRRIPDMFENLGDIQKQIADFTNNIDATGWEGANNRLKQYMGNLIGTFNAAKNLDDKNKALKDTQADLNRIQQLLIIDLMQLEKHEANRIKLSHAEEGVLISNIARNKAKAKILNELIPLFKQDITQQQALALANKLVSQGIKDTNVHMMDAVVVTAEQTIKTSELNLQIQELINKYNKTEGEGALKKALYGDHDPMEFLDSMISTNSELSEIAQNYISLMNKIDTPEMEFIDTEGITKLEEFLGMSMPLFDEIVVNGMNNLNQGWNMVAGTASMYFQSVQAGFKQEMEELKNSDEFKRKSKRGQEQAIDDLARKQKGAKETAWRQQQALSAGEIIMNTASAIINSLTAKPPWAGVALAITAGVMGAAQLAIVNSQSMPKFAAGGMIGGRRHSQGGTMIEAEQGEFVMSRSAVQSVGIENLNRMNQGGGGAVTVNVSGNVLTEDFVSGELAENIKEAIRRGTDFGIS